MLKARHLLAVFAFTSTSCASDASLKNQSQSLERADLALSVTSDDYRGVTPSLDRSRMFIGETRKEDTVGPFSRRVGTDGAVATQANGHLIGVPDATSAAVLAPVYKGTGDQHNADVTRYFVEMGLDADQIGSTNIHANMAELGQPAQDSLAGKRSIPVFQGYTTVLQREVAGVLVYGSFAWARMNASGDVVSEEAFWPTIPREVVALAQKLNESIQDPTGEASLRSKLPEHAKAGRVTAAVMHSPPLQSDVEFFAGYLVQNGSYFEKVDSEGEPLRFAWEIAALGAAENVKPRFE